MKTYAEHIESKRITAKPQGLNVDADSLPSALFDFQRASVIRALQLGRSALFANTGLGKGFQELAWASAVATETNKPVLLLAPLAVSRQFLKEAKKLGTEVRIVESDADIGAGINISNYEKLHKLSSKAIGGIVLDEASILKNSSGKYSKALIDFASNIPFRLAGTATPSPNDFEEFGTQAEFLGVMTQAEMLATFFTHDGGETSKWRLKKWGEDKFWQWLASWATVYRMPSDIGYSDEGFVLPPLSDRFHAVESALEAEEGELFATVATMGDRRKARKASISDRVAKAVELATADSEPHLIWCELNAEADALESAIPGAKQVSGSQTPEQKERILNEFSDGELRVLISKPSICGSGMNWQHCANVTFVGINDSWESLYQATNRVYRFGQTKPVTRNLIFSEHEYPVFQNLKRKGEQADRMWGNASKYFSNVLKPTDRFFINYQPIKKMELPSWL